MLSAAEERKIFSNALRNLAESIDNGLVLVQRFERAKVKDDSQPLGVRTRESVMRLMVETIDANGARHDLETIFGGKNRGE